jgi:hypothetical protein
LQGKAIISRNYRGDVPLPRAIEQFQNYLMEVDEEAKKPIFHVDSNGEISVGEDVGANGVGGEHFVYVAVSTGFTVSPPFPTMDFGYKACDGRWTMEPQESACSPMSLLLFLLPCGPAYLYVFITASKRLFVCCVDQELKCRIDFDIFIPTCASV